MLNMKIKGVVLKRLAFVVVVLIILEGCVAGQSIALPYDAEKVESQSNVAVAVVVEDRRPLILDGDKAPNYIGHYRAGFGNTWDVTTESDLALADIMQQDLLEEVSGLGFMTGVESPSRSLRVAMKGGMFETYMNGRFWYELVVTVFDEDSNSLASSNLQDDLPIAGNFWVGAKYAMEEEIPRLYGLMLKAIVRENDEILNALVGDL